MYSALTVPATLTARVSAFVPEASARYADYGRQITVGLYGRAARGPWHADGVALAPPAASMCLVAEISDAFEGSSEAKMEAMTRLGAYNATP